MSEEWKEYVTSSVDSYMKRAAEDTIRNRQMLAMLARMGRGLNIRTSLSGTDFTISEEEAARLYGEDWEEKYRDLQGMVEI